MKNYGQPTRKDLYTKTYPQLLTCNKCSYMLSYTHSYEAIQKNNMNNFIKNQQSQFDSLLEALRPNTTTEPDGIVTELIEGAVDRDGSYHEAYEDYVATEMNSINRDYN